VLSINDWWKAARTDLTLCTRGIEDILNSVDIEYFTRRKIAPIYQELIVGASVGKILKRMDHQRFDVHLNYNSLLAGYFVARKLESAGVKTVYDIADDLPAMVRTSPQLRRVLRPLAECLAKMAIRKNVTLSDRVTITAEVLRNALRVPQSKTVHVPNGVDIELFRNQRSPELRKELGLDQSFVLGYVGYLREWVDLGPFFSVLTSLESKIPDMKVLIAGETGALNEKRALMQRYGVSDKVVFVGTIPYTQVPQYISCMDVCLLPFKKDAVSQSAVPLKLFEYMACEKPVISTPLAGVKQAVGDRVLYASDAPEVRREMIKLFENQDLRTRMGLEGRRFVEENCSWPSACTKLEEILSKVANGERR